MNVIKGTTPNGNHVLMAVRPDTVDHLTVDAIMNHDEYDIRGRSWSGWALDVGSHIGTFAIAVAIDNPDLQVVAIEPVPENAEAIRASVALNGLIDRVHVVEAGASDEVGVGTVSYDFRSEGDDAEFVFHNRFIGDLFRGSPNMGRKVTVATETLENICKRFGIDRLALVKTDCEGGEWRFLSDAEQNDRIGEVIGEFHDRPWPAISTLLAETHASVLLEDNGGHGLFRAVHK